MFDTTKLVGIENNEIIKFNEIKEEKESYIERYKKQLEEIKKIQIAERKEEPRKANIEDYSVEMHCSINCIDWDKVENGQ